MDEINEYIFNALECAAISAITEIEEKLIGIPGMDGEDALKDWKPIGLINALEGTNGKHIKE